MMLRLTFGTLAGVLLSTALHGQTVNGVRIRINSDAAADAKLHISSKLLNLAQIVSR